MSSDLPVEFCNVRFINPFVVASSPSTDSVDMISRAFDAGWAGVVIKTIPAPGSAESIAYPIIASLKHGRYLAGFHNIDLFSEQSLEQWAENVRYLKQHYPDRVVIASIVGDTKEEWQHMAREMAAAGADIIECSLSCPQGSALEGETNTMGSMISQDPHLTEKVARWIKDAVPDTPITVKLTSGVTDLTEIVQAVERSGADGVCLIDSVEALVGVDLDTLEPMPSVQGYTTYGGYTGRGIKPIALRSVANAAKGANLPISGVGGIYNWRDAAEFLLLGATIVQVCSAVMEKGFDIVSSMTDGLGKWMETKGFQEVEQIVGLSLPRIVEHDKLPRGIEIRAHIDQETCIGCQRCFIACRDGGHQAISWNSETRRPSVDVGRCVGCGLCPQVCPVPGCITLQKL
jgi:dihydropyrimidine dehydrogenase (NAD+) subunit PreA